MPVGSIVTNCIPQNCQGKVIVLPSARDFPREYIEGLRNSMDQGAWIILERAARFSSEDMDVARELLGNPLGIELRECVRAGSQIYVQYRWPAFALVRAFHQVALLNCPAADVIAEYSGVPVAMKRRYGNGGVVFLGSMLGPGIRAGEPQARQVAEALFGLPHLRFLPAIDRRAVAS